MEDNLVALAYLRYPLPWKPTAKLHTSSLVLPCKQYQNTRRPIHPFNSISTFYPFSKYIHAGKNVSLVLYQDLVLFFFFPLKQKKIILLQLVSFHFQKGEACCSKYMQLDSCGWNSHTDRPFLLGTETLLPCVGWQNTFVCSLYRNAIYHCVLSIVGQKRCNMSSRKLDSDEWALIVPKERTEMRFGFCVMF